MSKSLESQEGLKRVLVAIQVFERADLESQEGLKLAFGIGTIARMFPMFLESQEGLKRRV